MAARIYTSIRPYLGGLALVAGSFGLLAFVLLIPLAIFSTHFWTGFSPDGPGLAPAEREASIASSLRSDAVCIFAPLFVGSVTLIAYGFYEAGVEQKRQFDSGNE
jgi:hypothetical protein